MKTKLFPAALLFLLLATPLPAGPRWWWNDVPVAATPGDSLSPDIALPAGAMEPIRAVFVVWQEIPPGETDTEIFLAASLDYGCSFCNPVRITTNDVDDLHPSVAAAVMHQTELMIHVAHETDHNIVVHFNVDPLSINDLSCATLEQANWTKTQVSQLSDAGCSKPDIAATVFNPPNPAGVPRFSVAWQQHDIPSGAPDDIFVAVDRLGNGSYGTPVNITNSSAACDSDPSIAISSGIPGVPPTELVSVAYLSGPGTPGSPNQVLLQYSTDSGWSWSGPVWLSGADACGPPAMDSGVQPYGLNDSIPQWFGASWLVPASSAFPPGLFFSGELIDFSRGGIVLPWLPAENLLPANQRTGEDLLPPAVSVLPYPSSGGDEDPFWVFWSDDEANPITEIYYRAGIFSEGSADVMNPDIFPIDGSVSVNTQLSGVAPPRSTASVAVAPASDEQSGYPPCDDDTVLVAWSDNRNGNFDIFFKRLDTCLEDASFTVSVPPCHPADGSVNVEWGEKNCPDRTEKLERILVYHSRVPGGPYILGAAPAPDEISASVPGLLPLTDYCFVVEFRDEAGNAEPEEFNPSVHSDPSPRGEICVRTNDPCPPASLEVAKTWIDVNGPPLVPGDTVSSTITVSNTGNAVLTGVEIRDDVDVFNLDNFVIPDPDGSWLDADTVRWVIGDLPIGGNIQRSFSAAVKGLVGTPPAPVADGTPICNDTYSAASDETGTVSGTPPQCLAVGTAILSIAKAIVTEEPQAGQPIDYEISVCNTGSVPETGVVVRDTPDPTGLETPPLEPGGGIWIDPPGVIEWTIGTLNPGPCTTLTCSFTIKDTWLGSEIGNAAAITETSGLYHTFGWELPPPAQVTVQPPPNYLFKSCQGVFPLPPFEPIDFPPGQTADTGVTDTSNPLCFYQVQLSISPNSVRIVKSTVADTMDIYY
jgi:uncharacterized repeat protein (TIGR01451 family)